MKITMLPYCQLDGFRSDLRGQIKITMEYVFLFYNLCNLELFYFGFWRGHKGVQAPIATIRTSCTVNISSCFVVLKVPPFFLLNFLCTYPPSHLPFFAAIYKLEIFCAQIAIIS
ncbi:hypothetical protein SADUNF_Sadunf16G0073000 [Salix dunnii]|uniref:Uncharacterized protein n=1 Tax=Salix dunnii TaxID=1413687 RepID=A0A835J7H1_9ROSI|nr:hypothetical protein SADUNF_Sadunf16G0073000 [Salix dunnii]